MALKKKTKVMLLVEELDAISKEWVSHYNNMVKTNTLPNPYMALDKDYISYIEREEESTTNIWDNWVSNNSIYKKYNNNPLQPLIKWHLYTELFTENGQCREGRVYDER